MTNIAGLTVVQGDALPAPHRAVLRPGETMIDEAGRPHVLPRDFFRIDSWQQARETPLTEHFMLWELIGVDVREAAAQRTFPRYVPCAVLLLAHALELFRQAAGTYVHVASNGGYRSPAHGLTRHASRHCWATAANIYRIGDAYLESRDEIEKYASLGRRVLPGAWVRPYGGGVGEADDHVHLDLGYTTFEPVTGHEAVPSE